MGIAFAVIEIVGGLINFAEEPIIERKRTSGELDWFNYTIVAGACVAILPTFLQLPLTFKRSTSCHRALDETRQEMLKAQNSAVTAGKEEKILSAKGNFEHDSNLE
ncbi:Oidioi.mRNA.OKI2018_I69.XSR.g14071.t1.cds [Oikopleura dioica]|uniref:Oidioi.mRNA.OKI2018_I69.XSR.g14071.t1.cds n=1 Tax=Oikopleura dioica TaxID=34765 RepID=A0ABN7S9A1_OIKDI|nr:Oidioi.mRNA.OKI2018_I69.XSR.g14071.t1.cds [Oikopleura dioica]